ncbi:MAG: hypothetical protein O7G87_13720 [bacterium]|nr:hypothetical protein [bacterium]
MLAQEMDYEAVEEREFTIKETQYVCQDGVWYKRVDVTTREGEAVDQNTRKALSLVDGGYACEDGIWYWRVAVKSKKMA